MRCSENLFCTPGAWGCGLRGHLLQIPETEVIAAVGEDRNCPPEWRLIDRTEAKALFPPSLAEPEFCKALSLSTRQFEQLRDAGLLRPVEGGFWNVWAAQDLIDDLLYGADPISFILHGRSQSDRSLGPLADDISWDHR